MMNFILEMESARKLDFPFHKYMALVVTVISILAGKTVLGTCSLR